MKLTGIELSKVLAVPVDESPSTTMADSSGKGFHQAYQENVIKDNTLIPGGICAKVTETMHPIMEAFGDILLSILTDVGGNFSIMMVMDDTGDTVGSVNLLDLEGVSDRIVLTWYNAVGGVGITLQRIADMVSETYSYTDGTNLSGLHTLGLTYTQSTNNVDFYIDGVLVGSDSAGGSGAAFGDVITNFNNLCVGAPGAKFAHFVMFHSAKSTEDHEDYFLGLTSDTVMTSVVNAKPNKCFWFKLNDAPEEFPFVPPTDTLIAFSFKDTRNLMPYNVKSISGLDADEIVPKYYGTFNTKTFYNLTLAKREITILVGLNPDFSADQSFSSLRDNLYRVISSSRTGKVELGFINDEERVAVISGSVSKFTTDHFEKMQEVELTIKCSDSMLKAPSRIELDGGDHDTSLATFQDDVSTAPHGFIFVLSIDGDLPDINLSDPNDDSWSFQITPDGGFIEGDLLFFSSEYNNKYLFVLRDDEFIYLEEAVAIDSAWPIMFPGENNFVWTYHTSLSWVSISYYPTYWGV